MDEHDRLLVLERDVAHIDKTLSEVKADMKSGFTETNKKSDDLNKKFDDGFRFLNEKIDGKFNLTLSMFGGGVLLIIGFIYFFFGKSSVAPEQRATAPISMTVPLPSTPAAVPVSESVSGSASSPRVEGDKK